MARNHIRILLTQLKQPNNKMKKLIILMVIATISTSVFAQIGVQVGGTFASFKVEDKTTSSANQTSDSKIGFTLGVFTNVPLSTNFIFRPELNYTQKGGKVEGTFGTTSIENKLTLNYLELPLNFIYKATGGFFVGAGPALGYGIGGKAKTKSGSTSSDEKIKFGSDENEDDLKAMEFAGNLLAGYQMENGITLTVLYNMGFSNLSHDPDQTFKNRYFGIKIGKIFGGDKK